MEALRTSYRATQAWRHAHQRIRREARLAESHPAISNSPRAFAVSPTAQRRLPSTESPTSSIPIESGRNTERELSSVLHHRQPTSSSSSLSPVVIIILPSSSPCARTIVAEGNGDQQR
ncbi:hypothetical protein DM860_013031 [Cuscuta australis]|uniref:Uncharacterized protein n=1 Tax=Cuscuta australis TaxID=267555 RepID=A0A328D429_9ASTE|nr:hypothetical protein DM860_013031 [Cuscuta australis]